MCRKGSDGPCYRPNRRTIDSNKLAAEHLRRNLGERVIQGSVGDMNTIWKAHQKIAEQGSPPFSVLAGFPCQPFSRQGSCQEHADGRFSTYPQIIKAIILLGPQAVLLECVPNAGKNAKVQEGLQVLMERLGWQKHETVNELSSYWPMRRKRWFCVLAHEDWIRFMGPDEVFFQFIKPLKRSTAAFVMRTKLIVTNCFCNSMKENGKRSTIDHPTEHVCHRLAQLRFPVDCMSLRLPFSRLGFFLAHHQGLEGILHRQHPARD